ncbi:hypothetical protein HS088_TW08G00604 [Tripterygium wilfordii]|uniref:50S ribosomal protein L16, chloroplastic n=1 Tax=Tripterygium wilfordii TaxID=458696 RepID=A0A7J7DD67_TRIWF|nr:hypothetical protein HS088_TW08G00604 [Tripterygium wilfordii]
MQALEPVWITSRQIEAGQQAMTRNVRCGRKIWVRLFLDKPVTVKPTETRMGSGKGSPEYWVAVIKPEFKRENGMIIRYDDNAAIVIDQDGNPKGTRIFDAITRELSH